MSFTPTPFIEDINSTSMVEVSQESDFGPAVLGVITPAANTAYFVRGNVNCTNRLAFTNANIAVVGWDRDVDGLTYTGAAGAGDFITVTDVNFQLANLKLSSTNSTGGDVVLRAVNYNQPDYNAGRDKVLTIINCQFRNCYDVWYIEGFDLADIQNTLVWYIEATTIGCQFKNVSKLQISSCEYVRWFDETSIPTPSGYATAPMIELLDNAGGSGFGAVNISGSILHPQQTQDGINISTSSTTGFGTISANTFINIGLTTGEIFNPIASGLPDYSDASTLTYDVLANQGILNSTSGCVMTMNGNTQATALVEDTPTKVDTDSLAVAQASVRYTVATDGRVTYNGTKQIYVSLHASLSYNKSGGGADEYSFYFYKNGVQLPGSATLVDAELNGSVSMVYGTLMSQTDYIEVFVENTQSGDDMLVIAWQVLVRE